MPPALLNLRTSAWPILPVLVAAVAACHDARRDNPMDPALTPSVVLQAAVDDSAGTVSLEWSPYAGSMPLAAYWLLRNEVDRISVDTLAVLEAAGQTTFADTTARPNTAYAYRVSVVNAEGLEMPSAAVTVSGYGVHAVELLEAETDSRRGEVRLRWRRYDAARFEAYRVERRQVGVEDEFAPIARVESRQDTALTDTAALPGSTYVYQVVVEAAGQEWASNRSGREGYSLAAVRVLGAEPDPEAGVIRVTWTGFEGPAFTAYRVLRRQPGGEEELLHLGLDPQDTAFADSTARAGVDYSYAVTVEAAGQELPGAAVEARLDLPAIDLEAAEFQSAGAAVALSWSRYRGPRFAGYRVERRTAELATQVVGRVLDPAVTSWTDAGIHGNTEYFYRVTVVTTLGEDLASGERSGAIHASVQEWPLDAAAGEYVRLYAEPAGGLSALVAGPSLVRLKIFGADGVQVSEQTLWESQAEELVPRSAATALLADGTRVLTLRLERGGDPDLVTLLHLDAQGDQRLYERSLFSDLVQALPSIDDQAIEGEVSVSVTGGSLEEVTVFAAGQLVLADDFEDEEGADWDQSSGRFTDGQFAGSLGKRDGGWQSPGLRGEAMLLNRGGLVGLRIGSSNSGFFRLSVISGRATLTYRWLAERPFVSEGTPLVVSPGVPFRFWLGVEGRRLSVGVTQPPFLEEEVAASTSFASVAALDDWVALSDGTQPYTLVPGNEPLVQGAFDRAVGELRIWKVDGERGIESWLGACVPEQHQVHYARTAVNKVTNRLEWSFGFTSSRDLGTAVGQEAGAFVFPLSLDGGRDGRVFVLDAGNARVQVFGRDGEYLTQWGTRGSGPGQFDFGAGLVPEDLAGSIAVDGEGYIYVADVGNGRIQKFAP